MSFLLLVFFRSSVSFFGSISSERFTLIFDHIRPYYAFIFLAILVFLYAFTVYRFIAETVRIKRWWNFIILPSCFSISIVAFMVLNSSTTLVWILFLLNFIFIYIYFRTIFDVINFKEKKDYLALENMSSYGNFLSVYFFGAAIYGLQSFLNLPVYFLMILFFTFITLVVYQVIWANRIESSKSRLFIVLVCMVMLQLAWSISFLTLSYYMLGLVLAIYYYVLIGIVRFYLRGKLDMKIVKLYIFFGAFSMLSVLLTATWL